MLDETGRVQSVQKTGVGEPPRNSLGDEGYLWIELPPPARKTIDLEGRLVKDGVREALRDRQLALAELVHAIREDRKISERKRLTLQGSDYAHSVHELNKSIDRAEGLLLLST